MRAALLTLIMSGLISECTAQSVNSAVNTELRFAQYALEHSVRQAFLEFADSTAVELHNGGSSNALEQWRSRPERKGKLLWKPVFSGMAADGRMGFTTGPYEARRASDDSLVQSGQYTTVWALNEKNEWKFLVDFGVSYRPSLYTEKFDLGSVVLTPSGEKDAAAAEKKFLEQYKAAPMDAYKTTIHESGWFNFEGNKPFTTQPAILQALTSSLPAFTPLGGKISGSGDLAFIYGATDRNGDKNNYLRIWGHTPGGWKILVQVMK